LNIESAKISRERVVQDVKTNIQTALSEQKSAKQQYLASQKTFEARKRAFENSTKQYNAGTIGTYEYLNSKTLYEQAQNTLVISKYQYLFRTKILEFYLGENLSFKN
ncbi:MAG TPA: TolC family protein, partial [Bacteroidetes bacterium]|nr:TolC family protein [Bacteroidota bacterium]